MKIQTPKLLVIATLALASFACSNQGDKKLGPVSPLCADYPCTVGGKDAADYYSKYEAKQIGTCADQSQMSFNTMIAQSVQSSSNDGFASIRLDLDPAGTYTGYYVSAQPVFGTLNPSAGSRTVKQLSGRWHLGFDKIILEGIGLGHVGIADAKGNSEEVLMLPLSSSGLDVSATAGYMSFTHVNSQINAQGQTVAQVCAAQAPAAAAPAPAPTPEQPVVPVPAPAPVVPAPAPAPAPGNPAT